MPLRVLIVPDKFKGTLTAGQAAEAIARGWRKHRPHDVLDLLPMSDGGEGFGKVTSGVLNARMRTIKTVDAAQRACRARWWLQERTGTAVIETAEVIGLAMLPPGRFHPFSLDTFGLGKVILRAQRQGARRCLLGIGGSATNDGGFGLARALGWKFLDYQGNPLERWTALDRLKEIRAPNRRYWFEETLVAVDVQNPLLGPRGASRVYGPQKGLRKEDFVVAERSLRRLARVFKSQFAADFAGHPGAGAAGGLGFGLLAFLGARLEPGFDLFAGQVNLVKRIRSADLAITGEGAIDRSTLMGKGVGQVARLCRELKIPCLGLAGVLLDGASSRTRFTRVLALTQITTVTQAKANPSLWLERLSASVSSTCLEVSADA